MQIKNKSQLIKNAKTKKIQKLRRDILEALEVGVSAVDPYFLIKNNLKLRGKKLEVAGKLSLNLAKFKNIYVIGAGKATLMMAVAISEILKDKIKKGFINVPEIPSYIKLKNIYPTQAAHPYPNRLGLLGAKKILKLALAANFDDLVFVLISGGGSSLLPYPAKGLTLQDEILMNKILVQSPAKIEEINTIRKHISAIKGGWLARALYPAKVICLYLSDVVGDDLSTIASGPCVPDRTTFFEAIQILKKYNLWEKAPRRVQKYLLFGLKNKKLETPKPGDKIFKGKNFFHFILGSNKVALNAMMKWFKLRNYNCQILTDKLEGEIHYLSKIFMDLAKKIKENKFSDLPFSDFGLKKTQAAKIFQSLKGKKAPRVILAGGETTLELQGKGMGGRNQEFVMVSVPFVPSGVVFTSFNTDGVDGRTPFPVAGGICDEWTYKRGKKLGLKIEKYIQTNDSYHYLKKLGEIIITGKTGTNVGDIVVLGIS